MSNQHHVCLWQVSRSGKGGFQLDHQGWLHEEAFRKTRAGLVRLGRVDREKRGYEQNSESGEHKWNSERITKKLYSRNQELGFFLTWKSLIFVSSSSKTWFPRSQICCPKATNHLQQPHGFFWLSSFTPFLHIFSIWTEGLRVAWLAPGIAHMLPSGLMVIKNFPIRALWPQSMQPSLTLSVAHV